MTQRHIASCIAVLLLASCSRAPAGSEAGADPVALVALAPAQTGSVAASLMLYGAVEQNADTQFTLAAPVEATIARIAAPAGSAVARGDIVVSLSPSPATRSQIAQFAAEARTAQAAYERAQRLRADGLVGDAEVESARAAAQGAQAQRAALATQAGQLSLRTPGAGFVQAIISNPGDLVSAGATIATISRTGDLRARLGIDPALVGRVARGAGVRLRPAGGGEPVTVPIVSLDPSLDPQTRLASLYVRVPATYRMGAGQALEGEVTLEQAGNAVVVPYAALLDDGGQPYVFTVSDGVAHRKDVLLGALGSDSVAIAGGLQAGEQVVTQGGTALEDGMKVRTR